MAFGDHSRHTFPEQALRVPRTQPHTTRGPQLGTRGLLSGALSDSWPSVASDRASQGTGLSATPGIELYVAAWETTVYDQDVQEDVPAPAFVWGAPSVNRSNASLTSPRSILGPTYLPTSQPAHAPLASHTISLRSRPVTPSWIGPEEENVPGPSRSRQRQLASPATPGTVVQTGQSRSPLSDEDIMREVARGEILSKYTRPYIIGHTSLQIHDRFFWIDRAKSTLWWSTPVQGSSDTHEDLAKSVQIISFSVARNLDEEYTDVNRHTHSIIVFGHKRHVKFTACNKARHDLWVLALGHVLQEAGLGRPRTPDIDEVSLYVPWRPLAVLRRSFGGPVTPAANHAS